MVVERGMKAQMAPSAHGGPVDRAEYGLMAGDETHVADEVERGRLIGAVDGHRDEIGDRCKADLGSFALRRKARHEGEWAQREQTRSRVDCEQTLRSVLKVVVRRETRGHESLCSLLVHLEDPESLRYGMLIFEALQSVHLTRWQGCFHFDSLLALVELGTAHDKVELHAVER